MSENQNYIDLKINGKRFPLWMMLNLKNNRLDNFGSDTLNSTVDIKSISGQYRAITS
jgi:hypothetical protein